MAAIRGRVVTPRNWSARTSDAGAGSASQTVKNDKKRAPNVRLSTAPNAQEAIAGAGRLKNSTLDED